MTVPKSWQGCAGPGSLWDMHVEELGSDQITFLSEPQIAAEYVIHMYVTGSVRINVSAKNTDCFIFVLS